MNTPKSKSTLPSLAQLRQRPHHACRAGVWMPIKSKQANVQFSDGIAPVGKCAGCGAEIVRPELGGEWKTLE